MTQKDAVGYQMLPGLDVLQEASPRMRQRLEMGAGLRGRPSCSSVLARLVHGCQ